MPTSIREVWFLVGFLYWWVVAHKCLLRQHSLNHLPFLAQLSFTDWGVCLLICFTHGALFRTSKHSPLEMSWFARSMPNSVSLTGRVRLGVVEDETRRVCSSCGNPWRPSNGPGWYIVAHHSTTSQHLPLPSLQTWISRQLALESFSRPATRTLQELFTLQYPYYLAFLSTTGGISILPNTAQDHPITSCSPAHYTRCSL